MAVKDVVVELHLVVVELHLQDLGSDLLENVQAHQRPASAQSQSKVTAYRMRVRLSALNAYHGGHAATCDGIGYGAALSTDCAPAS